MDSSAARASGEALDDAARAGAANRWVPQAAVTSGEASEPAAARAASASSAEPRATGTEQRATGTDPSVNGLGRLGPSPRSSPCGASLDSAAPTLPDDRLSQGRLDPGPPPAPRYALESAAGSSTATDATTAVGGTGLDKS